MNTLTLNFEKMPNVAEKNIEIIFRQDAHTLLVNVNTPIIRFSSHMQTFSNWDRDMRTILFGICQEAKRHDIYLAFFRWMRLKQTAYYKTRYYPAPDLDPGEMNSVIQKEFGEVLVTYLKRCPYCGHRAEIVTLCALPFSVVGCTYCGASIEHADRNRAIQLWNTRFQK